MDNVSQLRFFRITCLGASESGKTSLVNAFVNGCFPTGHQTTEHATVFHRRLEILDKETVGSERRAYLVEVEDTPGSERGNDLDEAASNPKNDGKLLKGRLVNVKDDLQLVMKAFQQHPSLTFRPDVEHAMGRRGTITRVHKDCSAVTVTMRDGTAFELPASAVEHSEAMELPVDEFLHFGMMRQPKHSTQQDRDAYEQKSLKPFSAHSRPVGNPMMDRSLTRRRMAFFICFDLSDDTGESVKEAVAVYRMMHKRLEIARGQTVLPIIWLVGCKADRSHAVSVIKKNEQVARCFSEDVEIPFYTTSARNHEGIQELFRDMALAILEHQQLWNHCLYNEREDQASGGYCAQQ